MANSVDKSIAQGTLRALNYLAQNIGPVASSVGRGVSNFVNFPGATSTPASVTGELLNQLLTLASTSKNVPEVKGNGIKQDTLIVPALGLGAVAGKGMAESANQQLDNSNKILADVAVNEAKKAVKEQTRSLIEQGVPPEQIIETSLGQGVRDMTGGVKYSTVQPPQDVQPSSGVATAPAQQNVAVQPNEADYGGLTTKAGRATRKFLNPVGEVLSQILTLGGNFVNPDTVLNPLQVEQMKTLKYEREQGMTAADREKLMSAGIIDLQKELAKKGNPDALTPENSAKFNLLLEGNNSVNDIASMLLSGENSMQGLIVHNKFTPGFFKSQNARQLESSIERAIQARTRIETGAALQPKELKSTAKRYLPRIGDSVDTVQSRLKPLADFFSGSINIADPTGIHRQRATASNMRSDNAVVMVDKTTGQKALVDPTTSQPSTGIFNVANAVPLGEYLLNADIPDSQGSPLNFIDRLKLSFSDDIGAKNYLQKKFRFVEQDADGKFIVGNEPNNLQPIDPKGFIGDVTGDAADLANDIVVIASDILGTAVGTAVNPGFGSVAGAAIGSGAGEAANVAIGKALGVREDSAMEQATDIVISSAFGAGGQILGNALKSAGKHIIKPQVKKLLDNNIQNSVNASRKIDALSGVANFMSSWNKDDFKKAAYYGFNETLDPNRYAKEEYIQNIMTDFAKGLKAKNDELGKAVEVGKNWALNNFGNTKIKGSNQIGGQLLNALQQGNINIIDESGKFNKDAVGDIADRSMFKQLISKYFSTNPSNGQIIAKDLTVKEAIDAKDLLSRNISKYFNSKNNNPYAAKAFDNFFSNMRDAVELTVTPPNTPKGFINQYALSNRKYSEWKKSIELLKANGLDITDVYDLDNMFVNGKIASNKIENFASSLAKKSQSAKDAFENVSQYLDLNYKGKSLNPARGTAGIVDELNKYHAAQAAKNANPNLLRFQTVLSMVGLGYASEQTDIPGKRLIGPAAGAMLATPAGLGLLLKTGERIVGKAAKQGPKTLKRYAQSQVNKGATIASLSRLARVNSQKSSERK